MDWASLRMAASVSLLYLVILSNGSPSLSISMATASRPIFSPSILPFSAACRFITCISISNVIIWCLQSSRFLIRIRHIHIQADALTSQLCSYTFFSLGIVYVLDLYVKDIFYKFLAEFFVPKHFLEQKIVGNGHCIPVYLFVQIFTLLSDRYSSFRSSIVPLL